MSVVSLAPVFASSLVRPASAFPASAVAGGVWWRPGVPGRRSPWLVVWAGSGFVAVPCLSVPSAFVPVLGSCAVVSFGVPWFVAWSVSGCWVFGGRVSLASWRRLLWGVSPASLASLGGGRVSSASAPVARAFLELAVE